MKRRYIPIDVALKEAREEYGFTEHDGICACYEIDNMGFAKMVLHVGITLTM